MKLLAAFGIWDQDLFRQAVSHFATGYSAIGARKLGRFWSIEPIGEGRWQLHNEMAHHLQAEMRQRDPDTFEEIHRWGFAYFDAPLQGLEAKAIQAADAERLQRAFGHGQIIQPTADWAAWLEMRLEQLGKGTIWQPLLAVAERGAEAAAAALGVNNPAVAALLNQQASLLHNLAEYAAAEPLYRRALDINEASYGNAHPQVATALNNLALLLQDTNCLAEAEPLSRRALLIFLKSLVRDHPNTQTVIGNYLKILQAQDLSEAELTAKLEALAEAFKNPEAG